MSPTTMVRPPIYFEQHALAHVAQDSLFDGAPLFQMLGDDVARVIFVHSAVPDAFRVDDHHRPAPALIQAFDFRHHHLAAQALSFE